MKFSFSDKNGANFVFSCMVLELRLSISKLNIMAILLILARNNIIQSLKANQCAHAYNLFSADNKYMYIILYGSPIIIKESYKIDP